LALLTTDLDQKYTIKKGTTEKFSLEIEPASVNLGQDISIHLKNISSESQRTGSRDHYAIQKKDNGEWDHIFSTKGNVLLDAQAVDHDPSDGFTWEFTVSPIGFSIGPYYVCKELKSGKYRFVYFGLPMMQHLKVPLRSRLISITCLNTLHESIMLGFASVTRMA